MKKTAIALSLILMMATPSYARNFVIGISPSISPSDTEMVFKKVVQFLLEEVHLGDEATIYDAYNNKLIGTFKVPNKRGYDHPKPKAKYNKKVLMRLKAFLSAEFISSEIPTNAASIIRFPQFISFVGENIKTDENTDVILIGNPLYIDFKETSFSMTEGFFPSDGHINASVKKSVFGTKERRGLLKGIKIHFAYRDVSWHNDLHAEMIKRFWSIYVVEQGGSLATFVSDLDTVIARAVDLESSNRRIYDFDKTNDKLEMLSVQREINRKHVNEVFDKQVTTTTHKPTSYKGKVLVGIKWDCMKCDLDLYARPENGKKVLFFGNTSSPEGTYHKDFLDSPTPVNGLEYIQFKKDVDIKNMFIAVNFYKGEFPSGPRGEIRIELNGVIYAKKFHIRSEKGNKGGNTSKMNSDSSWIVIKPLDIVLGDHK